MPDALVCREAIRDLHKRNPELVKGIKLIDSCGNFSPGEAVVPGPFARLELVEKN